MKPMKIKFNFVLLGNLRLWMKFMLLGLLVLPMVGLPTYFYIEKTLAEVGLAKREISGLPVVSSTVRLLDQVQRHGALATVFLIRPDADSQALDRLQGEIQEAVGRIETDLAGAEDGRVQGALLDVKAQWGTLSQLVKAKSLDADSAFSDHVEMSRKVFYLKELLLDYYKLSLDSDEHTSLMVRNVYVDFPAVTEPFAKVRSLGAARLIRAEMRRADPKSGGAPSAAERLALATHLEDATARVEEAGRSVSKVIVTSPALKEALEQNARDRIRASNRLIEKARAEVLDPAEPSAGADEFAAAVTEGIDGYYALIGEAEKMLGAELAKKADALTQRATYTLIEIAGLFLLGGILGFFIVRNVTLTVRALQTAVDRVRGGDETGLANIRGRDEIAALGRTVNTLLQDRISAQKKAEEENAQLNKSVIELMQTVYQLSNRDLTAHANVDESLIGTVASSINQLAGETGKVLGQVSRIAGNVDRASAQVKAQAERVQKTAENERMEVSSMVDDLSEAVTQMNLIAALAGNTNEAAENASKATDTALERVRETVAGMEGIRETIAETEKRIKRLGERSQEISGIVSLINTIAERTHVLALNAAMQAAIAGDAGRGFAVVAEEVQRLAESSRNATSQIATLINNIQIETNETIGTVNRTISQVVDGSELAKRAGEQMKETQRIATGLADLVQRIAAGTGTQNQAAIALKDRISDIGRSSEQTSRQIEEQAAETAALAEAARQLNSAISVFKLPRQVLESDTAAHAAVPREPLPAAA